VADPPSGASDGAERVGVLIVDDQAPFRRAARAVVTATPGFEVIGEAESGEEAVELAEDLAPEVVLMDINLPGINGIEATRRITAAHPNVRPAPTTAVPSRT
jgi:DNA-binding NarL/FixJ family response regulator